mgnify:CR=1 FL=1
MRYEMLGKRMAVSVEDGNDGAVGSAPLSEMLF